MGDFDGKCSHLGMINDVTPSSPDQCLQCVEMGDDWVHLRLCVICGRVGCCDSSKNKHATAHFNNDGHGIVKSHEAGEEWYWCYVDDVMFEMG